MRKKIHAQLPLVPNRINHQHADELWAISDLLDETPSALELIHADLVRGVGNPETGREGLSAEQVLRAIIVKQREGCSYEQLSFLLTDSVTYQAFCRIELEQALTVSTLQRNIKKVRAETLEEINRLIVRGAKREGLESGEKARVDCTVTETNIHHPTDSSLLWDSVRVLVRLMVATAEQVPFVFTNHSRRAKRRKLGIMNAARKVKRNKLYLDLIKVTETTVWYANQAIKALGSNPPSGFVEAAEAMALEDELKHFIGLTHRVLSQTRRRIIDGESVPAQEKIVSIFEAHTDIIRKDRRETVYGHKLCLTAAESGLVTDCIIVDGNPNDSTLAVRMIKRHTEIFGVPPRQVAFDGGFTSKANLTDIKALGVKDVGFSKGRGLEVTEMVKSKWVYRKLRNFRAGIEAIISHLKRCFGLTRCTWRGLASFKSYVWSSIISANLLTFARHRMRTV